MCTALCGQHRQAAGARAAGAVSHDVSCLGPQAMCVMGVRTRLGFPLREASASRLVKQA